MNDTQFLRTYQLKVYESKNPKKYVIIGNTKTSSQTTLRIVFDIEKGDSKSSNTAKVQVYNLAPNTIKFLEGHKLKAELRAGYSMNMPVIAYGAVTHVTTIIDGTDSYTEMEIVDGHYELKDTKLTISATKGITSKAVFGIISKKTGLPIRYGKGVKLKKLSKGWHFVGKSKAAIEKLCKHNGVKWSIQSGVLYISSPSKPMNTKPFLLTPQTGLIGRPAKITFGSGKKHKSGWEINYFLNGAIGVGDVVNIESDEAKGSYLVKNVKISGDNYGGDWVCTSQVLRYKK